MNSKQHGPTVGRTRRGRSRSDDEGTSKRRTIRSSGFWSDCWPEDRVREGKKERGGRDGEREEEGVMEEGTSSG